MTKDGPGIIETDPTYPRILLIPVQGMWMPEIQYSMEYSIGGGLFRDISDAVHEALLRIEKYKERNNRRPGGEEPGC